MKVKFNYSEPDLDKILKEKPAFEDVKNKNTPINKLTSIITALLMVCAITLVYFIGSNKINQQAANSLIVKDKSEVDSIYARKKRYQINPPASWLNVPFDTYRISAEKGGEIRTESGSLIAIPGNIFEDATGNLLKDTVEIRYREFMDGIDIAFSGIPMNYDSAGTSYYFKSAGMFELLAYADNKPVQLSSDKRITVDLKTKRLGKEYNVYYFDTTAGNWKYQGKDSIVYQRDTIFKNRLADVKEAKDMPLDSGVLKATIQQHPDIVSLNKQKEKCANTFDDLEKTKEKNKPRKPNPNAITFTLDLDSTFSEAFQYNNDVFEVLDQSTGNIEVNTKNLYSTRWEDVQVLEKNDTVFIKLRAFGDVYIDLATFPFVDSLQFTEQMKAYSQLKDSIEALQGDLIKQISRQEQMINGIIEREQVKNNLAKQRIMTTKQQMIVGYDYKPAFRKLRVRLGITNCDQPIRFLVLDTSPGQKSDDKIIERIKKKKATAFRGDFSKHYSLGLCNYSQNSISPLVKIEPDWLCGDAKQTDTLMLYDINNSIKKMFVQMVHPNNSESGYPITLNLKEYDLHDFKTIDEVKQKLLAHVE